MSYWIYQGLPLIIPSVWTKFGPGTLEVASETYITLTGNGVSPTQARRTLTTVPGQTYDWIFNSSSTTGAVSIGTTAGGTDIRNLVDVSVGLNKITFTAIGTTTHLLFSRQGVGSVVFNAMELVLSSPTASIPAVPAIKGFAANMDIGLGQPEYVVNKLEDDGTQGTFRHAVATGNRVITFEVGGVINLTSPLAINPENLYIAGQTAPYPGIILQGKQVTIRGKNKVLKHLSFHRCYDPTDLNNADGINFITSTGFAPYESIQNIWIDHCLFCWGIDEALQLFHNLTEAKNFGQNISLTNNIFCEMLYWPPAYDPALKPHVKNEEHAFNCFIGEKNWNVDYQKNLSCTGNWRNPRIGSDTSVFLVNNYVYNYGGTGITWHFNYAAPTVATVFGNVVESGPITNGPHAYAFWSQPQTAGSAFYFADNYIRKGSGATVTPSNVNGNQAVLYYDKGKPSNWDSTGMVNTPPITFDGVVPYQPDDLRAEILLNAGPHSRRRGNPVAIRQIENMRNGTGGKVNHENEVGGRTVLEKTTRALTAVAPKPSFADKEAVKAWLAKFDALVQYDGVPTTSSPEPVYTLPVHNFGTSASAAGEFLSFGVPFKQGAVPNSNRVQSAVDQYIVKGYVDGQEIPFQASSRIYWSDGSLKHAQVRVAMPSILAGGSKNIVISRVTGDWTANDDGLHTGTTAVTARSNLSVDISNLNLQNTASTTPTPTPTLPLKYANPNPAPQVTVDLNVDDVRTFEGATYSNKHVKVIPKTTLDTARGLVFNGCASVTIIGGHFKPTTVGQYGSGSNSTAIFTFNNVGKVYLEGCHLDGVNVDREHDGIYIQAQAKLTEIIMQNMRVENVYGTEAGFHGDIFQAGSVTQNVCGPVKIYNFTGTCNYQGFFIDPQPPGGLTSFDFENVNLRRTEHISPFPRLYYFYSHENDYLGSTGYPVTLNNVWADGLSLQGVQDCVWPSTGAGSQNQFPSSTCRAVIGTDTVGRFANWPGMQDSGKALVGKIYQGTPPGGDFAPANKVGLNYGSGPALPSIRFSVNEAFASGNVRLIHEGPLCTEWLVKGLFKNIADNTDYPNYHGEAFVRAWGGTENSPARIQFLIRSVFGGLHPATGINGQSFITQDIDVKTGSTVIRGASVGTDGWSNIRGWKQGAFYSTDGDGLMDWINAGTGTVYTKPTLYVRHDPQYLIDTKLVVPLDLNQTLDGGSPASTLYRPMGAANITKNMGDVGDRDDISMPFSGWSARALLAQAPAFTLQVARDRQQVARVNSLASGSHWANLYNRDTYAPLWFLPTVPPAELGSSYYGQTYNPNIGWVQGTAAGGWGTAVSHYPDYNYYVALTEGDQHHLEQLYAHAAHHAHYVLPGYGFRVSYYGENLACNAWFDQPRSGAWLIRNLCNAVGLGRPDDPSWKYLRAVLDENIRAFDIILAKETERNAGFARMGAWHRDQNLSWVQPYMFFYRAMAHSWGYGITQDPGVLRIAEHAAKFSQGIFGGYNNDPSQPEMHTCPFYASSYIYINRKSNNGQFITNWQETGASGPSVRYRPDSWLEVNDGNTSEGWRISPGSRIVITSDGLYNPTSVATGLVSGQQYYVINHTGDGGAGTRFQVSLTPDGAPIQFSGKADGQITDVGWIRGHCPVNGGVSADTSNSYTNDGIAGLSLYKWFTGGNPVADVALANAENCKATSDGPNAWVNKIKMKIT